MVIKPLNYVNYWIFLPAIYLRLKIIKSSLHWSFYKNSLMSLA